MKRVVTSGELTQRAMRPQDLLDEYLAHVEADIRRIGLLEGAQDRPCPACGAAGVPEFERLGFPYHRCRGCQTLFVTPVPDAERLRLYRTEGTAERFRRERVLPTTADVRARHAAFPRARWVLAMAASRLTAPFTVAHIGAEAPGLLEVLEASTSIVRWADIGAAPADACVDAVVAFDLLERSVDLPALVRRCRGVLRRRGIMFVTTLTGEGFEVRMLGARTASLVPPVHLQLVSRAGWLELFRREGFRLIEYSTPGELDVQAVADACRRNDLRLPPILDELVRHEDELVGRMFQELLQQACLSSHVQLVAERSDDPS